MRPSVSVDLFLLGVGERSKFRTWGAVGTAVSGALLCEKALAGEHLLPELPPSRGRRRALQRLIDRRAIDALNQVADPLCAAGAVRPSEEKWLRMFARRGYTVLDTPAQEAALHRLRAAITPGTVPAPDDAAFAVLCALSGIARSVLAAPEGRAARRETAAHLNGLRDTVGPAVAEILDATRAEYGRADADGGFVPSGGYDCYGDVVGDGGG
ncbi:MAG: GPP34 family phosphoprotein [Actinomycetota bacterium]|nr:GPP34 family phosphoprotein [Actinomycetota bacterium]